VHTAVTVVLKMATAMCAKMVEQFKYMMHLNPDIITRWMRWLGYVIYMRNEKSIGTVIVTTQLVQVGNGFYCTPDNLI
jgi:hypothetical protein